MPNWHSSNVRFNGCFFFQLSALQEPPISVGHRIGVSMRLRGSYNKSFNTGLASKPRFIFQHRLLASRLNKSLGNSRMWARIPIRDKIWALVALLSVLYFAVLSFSNCPWVDGPFAFVRGCKNYGIDWNSFMAPIGFFILCFAAPLSLVYWFLRIFQIGFRSLCFLCVACFRAKGK